MLTRFLLITTIAYFFRPMHASPNENLARILESTTRFFDQLRLDYDSLPRSPELYKLIDDRIDEYVNKVKKSTNLSRGKRQLNRDKDIRILSGFERVAGLDLSNVIDVTFFVYRDAGAARWYAAALNSSGISLYRYQPRNFSHVGFFGVENGDRLISQSNDVATLLVVQRRSLGDALVVRLSRDADDANGQKSLHGVHRINVSEVAYTAVWQGMRKIYLAVSSPREISIYVWLGKHFDHVQTLSIVGAKKIVPFRANGVMHLMTIEPRRAAIFKFLPHPRRFVIVQGLTGGADGTSFDLEKGHNGEYFVAVAGRDSSVVYKQSKHRFVPFQEIEGADEIAAFHDRVAILLFLVRKTGGLRILQYDGWKFVKSGVRDVNVVLRVRSVNLGDETFLAYRHEGNGDVMGNVEEVVDETNATERQRSKVEESSMENGTTWSFRKIVWDRKETWSSLRERTKLWCRDTLKNVSPVSFVLPPLEVPLRIERAHVGTLRTRQVNGRSAEKFVELRKRVDAIISETRHAEIESKRYLSTVNPVFKNLRARHVRLNCTTICRTNNMITEVKEDFLERIRWIDEPEQNFNFLNVRTSYASNLPCPYPAPKFQDVTTNGLVNGVAFRNFVDDLVKVTGDQVLTGSPVFSELRVQNAKIPMDIASDFTRQEIVAVNVHVDDLNVTSGHFLLPLRNDSSSVMSGSLAVRKVRIRGFLDCQGKIDGPGSAELSPMIEVNEHLEISGNFSLEKAKIVRLLQISDVEGPGGRSYNEIMSRAIPVDSDHVPVRLRFRNDRVSWSNVTSPNLSYKWLTKKSSSHVVITGHKNATQPVMTLGDKAHENLPIPRLPLRLCGSVAKSEGIWESNLVIDRGFAKSVRATNLFNGSELSRAYADAATSLAEVPWGLKNFTGRIVVGDASIGRLEGVDYQRWIKSFGRWREPGRLKGPVRFANLKLDQLVTSNFDAHLPNEARSIVTKANLYVGTLNGIDIDEFMKNAVKLDDTLSLTNFEFAGGLAAEEILASKTSFGLRQNVTSGYLGSKEISGKLICDEIALSNFPAFPPSDRPTDIIVNGNVRFTREPKIVNLNNENLDALFETVWLTNKPSKITADIVKLRNVTFESDLTILKSIETPNLGPWTELENRLLSKTRSQRINVEAAFERIVAPALVATPTSRLRTNVSYIHDLEYNSLKNDDHQEVTNSWNFDELIVTGNFDLRGLINGLNLSTDVVRRDVKRNTVTGKKTFRELKAVNVDGLRFGKFARRALRSSSSNNKRNGNETIVVKGWKTFKTVEMKNLRVDGTVMNRRFENLLLKSSDQKLHGTKVFHGFVATPSIVSEAGLVNGIKLRSFVDQQLKKRDASPQFIRTPIMLCNNVTILGNVTIEGLYNGVEVKTLEKSNDETFRPMAVRTTELLNHAEGIALALENRAVYWDKLELLEENAKPLISETPVNKKIHVDDALGDCGIVDFTLHCNDQRFWQPLPGSDAYSNGSRVVQAKLIDDSGRPLLTFVTADPGGGVFIFRYDHIGKNFYQEAELRVPGIVEGSLTTIANPLWISLRLHEHLMLLRYETWAKSFEQWILPGEGDFLMSSAPTDELLILRSNGIWKLGGLGGPRRIFWGALHGQIDTFTHGHDYYVQLTDENTTTLLKTRYIGD